jgi:hypothetical protein
MQHICATSVLPSTATSRHAPAALKALEMFAKLSGEAARECLEVFAPHLLAAGPVVSIDVSRSCDGEPPVERNGS